MPFPSKGCDTCRSRHVKCDENRPICMQCSKAGRVCRGFDAEPGGLVFRNENEYASNKDMKRPRGGARRWLQSASNNQRRKSTPSPASSCKSCNGARAKDTYRDASATVLPLVALTKDIGCELADRAFLTFRREYLDNPTCPDNGIWAFLGANGFEWGSDQPPTCFNLAAMAVSLAVAAMKANDQADLEKSRHIYTSALLKTRDALCEDPVQPTDDLLMTCILLSAYEDRVSSFGSTTVLSEGFRHQNGAMILLKMRSLEPTGSGRNTSIDRYIRRQLLRSSLYRSAPLPDWLEDGALFGETGHELELDHCLVKIITVRHNLLSIFKALKVAERADRHFIMPSLLRAIRDIIDLEASLKAWGLSAPSEYSYTTVDSETLRNASNEHLFYSPKAYIYKDYLAAVSWNRCRGARLIANGLIQKAVSWAHILAHPGEQIDLDAVPGRAESIRTVQQLVDDVCASVPYHFGATEAGPRSPIYSPEIATNVYTLVWPLIFCAGVKSIPDLQRDWIRSTLDLIGKITDSAMVIAIAKMDLQNHSCLLKFDYESTPVESPQSDFLLGAPEMSPGWVDMTLI